MSAGFYIICKGCSEGRHYDCQVNVAHIGTEPVRCRCLATGHGDAVLPYAGTQGHSGTDTSRERAEREAQDGTATDRQAVTLSYLGERFHNGITVKELREVTGWHHGQASSALSVLHKAGHIARLKERRDRCKVYVLPVHVHNRVTEPHGRQTSDSEVVDLQARLLKAAGELTTLASGALTVGEHARLIAEREGVTLALSYVEEMLR